MSQSLSCAAVLFLVSFCTRPLRAESPHGADILLREARANEAQGAIDRAIRRASEALDLDPTLGEAYLMLGGLRLRSGDLREADTVYSVALAHVPTLTEALAARARVRWSLGRRPEATGDLFDYATRTQSVAALRELASWYGEDQQRPAELATWRWLLRLATAHEDEALIVEARITVRALQIVVNGTDPVTSPAWDTPERRLIRRLARTIGG